MSCVQCSLIFPARTINPVLSVACRSFLIFATMVELMLYLPQLSSSPATQVLLRTASDTLNTRLIFCILGDLIPISFYVSVYEFYPAIRKSVSLQCISSRRLTSCLISQIVTIFLFLSYLRSGKRLITKKKYRCHNDTIRSCLRHMELHS